MFSSHQDDSSDVGGLVKFGLYVGIKGALSHSMFARRRLPAVIPV